MQRDAIDFGSDNIPKLFGKMLMPTLLGMLCISLMTIIDGVFIGHGVGSDALAAVNIFSPFWLLMTAIGLMLGIGCSVVSSIHLSRDNEKAARINMTQTIIFGTALTLTITILVQCYSTQTAYLLGSSDRLLPHVLDYQRWLSLAFCAMFIQSVGLLIIRLDGSPTYAMFTSSIPAILNIVLDYIFLFVLDKGLAGVSFATFLALWFGAGMVIFAGFESEGKHLYLSDFESYLRESQLETFIPGGDSEIIVSTIHKAKGREFDNVYVSLKGLRVITDKERRAVYVAMTRAKKNLAVHYDNPALFDRNVLSAVNYAMDETDYGQPAEILIQMGHKDVVLNAFINKRIDFAAIHSGRVLNVGDDGLYLGFTRVVKFSGAFTKKLQALCAKGYIPSSAKVRVQVFWHHEDKEVTPPKWHHYMILLPDIWFTINSN